MRIERAFTAAGRSPYDGIGFRTATSEIRNPDGSVVFRLDQIEVPSAWSQVAVDVLAQKYFRKAGIAARLVPADEPGVPDWLQRRRVDTAALEALPEAERHGGETSAKQVFDRLAGTWTWWGWKGGYFDSEADAQSFFDELRFMLACQYAAPNSPQWFNTGLNWAYGIDGPAQGHYFADDRTGEVNRSASAYERPQPHACFIQSIQDDLVNPGGIMDLWVREARLFKYGSGTGTNFSSLRGENEPLSGGGKSSGLMSFLKIGDRAAGAIKSGGTTRRAAKMVVVDVDHPDIFDFVRWKVTEEQKVAALVAGSKLLARHLNAILGACHAGGLDGEARFSPKDNPELKKAIRSARAVFLPENALQQAILFARQGYTRIELPTYSTDWDSDAYLTVSGQNSNNSVRVTGEFLERVLEDREWQLVHRTDRKVARSLPARELWDEIARAAWGSADPGIQYDTTINEWHTCPVSGRINASNPCSEYMFLDDTACNLASLNLIAFLKDDGGFDTAGFAHAVRLWTIVLEISVMMAQYPAEKIAELSYRYRTLGLGYANLGGLLMASGIAYDSHKGRALAGALTALMTGTAYAVSAEMAGQLGPFAGFGPNREAMLKVIRNHRRAAHGEKRDYEGLSVRPVALDAARVPIRELVEAARKAWDQALQAGETCGYRNAQTTVIAPTGTIGLVMDCDTTGIEPDFALVKFKKLAGGGYFKIINRMVPRALARLGYLPEQIDEVVRFAVGHGTLIGAPEINHETLAAKGFPPEVLDRLERALPAAFDIKYAFNHYTLGEAFCRDVLGITDAQLADPRFDLLAALGFSRAQYETANLYCCGAMTVEGAPHLKAEHLRGVRLRQPLRPPRPALPRDREPHQDDGGRPAVHLGRDLQDHQHAGDSQRRGLRQGLSRGLAARPQGDGALSRRLETVAAPVLEPARRSAARGRRRRSRRGHRAHDAGRRARGRAPDRRAQAAAQPAQGLHPEGRGRRPQGLSPHRRVRRRPDRRDLHRHAQGRGRLPLADEQLRDRGLDRPAVRRAARGVRRGVRLHPLRALRPGPGQRHGQDGELGARLHLPRARDLLPRSDRPRACRPERVAPRQHRPRRPRERPQARRRARPDRQRRLRARQSPPPARRRDHGERRAGARHAHRPASTPTTSIGARRAASRPGAAGDVDGRRAPADGIG